MHITFTRRIMIGTDESDYTVLGMEFCTIDDVFGEYRMASLFVLHIFLVSIFIIDFYGFNTLQNAYY